MASGALVALSVFVMAVILCVIYALLIATADQGMRPAGALLELETLPPPPPP